MMLLSLLPFLKKLLLSGVIRMAKGLNVRRESSWLDQVLLLLLILWSV